MLDKDTIVYLFFLYKKINNPSWRLQTAGLAFGHDGYQGMHRKP